MYIRTLVISILALLMVALYKSIDNEALPQYEITIENHYFKPQEMIVPANQKLKLIIKNLDDSVEEFESIELKREKLVPAKSQITTIIGPLEPGIYKYYGEFHDKTAQGLIKAE